jgi:hypothetical protein
VRSETGDSGRFRISVIGWLGIAALVLGLAYFVLLPGGSENAMEGKSAAPEARAK